jgi:hypothetical protein
VLLPAHLVRDLHQRRAVERRRLRRKRRTANRKGPAQPWSLHPGSRLYRAHRALVY